MGENLSGEANIYIYIFIYIYIHIYIYSVYTTKTNLS